MKLNIKIIISLNNYLALFFSGWPVVGTIIFYDLYPKGIFLLIPLYILLFKILTYWHIKLNNNYFFTNRFLFYNFQKDVNTLKKFEMKKVLGFTRFKLFFVDGSTFKFIGIPNILFKEHYDGTIQDLLNQVINDNPR